VGTADDDWIAIDARSGKPVWSVNTTEAGDARIINGPAWCSMQVMGGSTRGDTICCATM